MEVTIGTILLILVSTLVTIGFLVLKNIYSYFEKRNVPFVKPLYFFGSDVKLITIQDNLGVSFRRLYNGLKEAKIGGCFLGISPNYIIRDPDYIKLIFTTYFESFSHRGFVVNEKANPLEQHLFFLNGKKWRFLRTRVSRTFSPTKLKYMNDEILKYADQLVGYLDGESDGKDVDLKEIISRFSTDVIGSTAFGLEINCMKDPDVKLRAVGRKIFDPSVWNGFLWGIRFIFPELTAALGIRTTRKEVHDYFRPMIQRVIDFRRSTNASRKDFLQLILNLQEEASELNNADKGQHEPAALSVNGKSFENMYETDINDNIIAAHCFVFFAAGFETTSATLYYLLYMFSLNEQTQNKARDEINYVKKKYGDFTYESLREMTYVDNCLSETLRLFPPLSIVTRRSVKDVTFPDGTLIEKGTTVVIPLLAIHTDPKNFPEPLKFKPERFEVKPRPGTYAPFGDGPRECIGKRFAMMEMKMTIAKLLEKFYFKPSPKNVNGICFVPAITLASKYPLYVQLEKIKN